MDRRPAEDRSLEIFRRKVSSQASLGVCMKQCTKIRQSRRAGELMLLEGCLRLAADAFALILPEGCLEAFEFELTVSAHVGAQSACSVHAKF